MLSPDAKREWITILAIGAMLSIAAGFAFPWALLLTIPATLALAAFFRDPERRIPTQRNAIVAPADGRISSVHNIEHYEPLDGPAVCVRIFLSVFNVHINRSPCHGEVESVQRFPGKHLNALNEESATHNEAVLTVLVHPIRRQRIAAVRQIAGMLARSVVCRAKPGDVVQRGQRIGIIKLGSTTELYLPAHQQPDVQVSKGQKVNAGLTVLAFVTPREATEAPAESTQH